MKRRSLAAVLVVALLGLSLAAAVTGLPGVGTGEPDAGTALQTEGASLTVPATTDATIAGETDHDSSTNLRVRLTSVNASSPFIRQATTTVEADGSFAVTFDLSAIETRTAMRVVVTDDAGTELVNTTGTVVAPPGGFDDSNDEDATTTPPGNDSTENSNGGMPDSPTASVDLAPNADRLTLNTQSDETVSGTSNLPAGTELVVRVRSSGSSPFLKTNTVTVGSGGDWSAAFDFADAPSGAEFEVAVRYNNSVLTEAQGLVRAENPDAAFSYNGSTITVATNDSQVLHGQTSLSQGSEVTIRLQSTNSSQPFIKQQVVSVRENGTFQATFDFADIEPGTTFTASVRHLDEDLTSAPGNVTT